jgi:hypothetical protein
VAEIDERAPSYGVYYSIRLGWLIPASQLTINPEPGDTITDTNSQVYTVVAAGAGQFGSCWKVATIHLVISDFSDTANYYVKSDSTDSYLSPLTVQGGAVPIRCRIQFEREEVEDFHGDQFFRNYFKVYVKTLEYDPQIGDTITATDGDYNGTIFRILSVEDIKELEDVICLNCTVDPVA